MENIPPNYLVRLRDKMNGGLTNLRKSGRYEFMIDKNDPTSYGDRFEILITVN
jgi:hypothetical protein